MWAALRNITDFRVGIFSGRQHGVSYACDVFVVCATLYNRPRIAISKLGSLGARYGARCVDFGKYLDDSLYGASRIRSRITSAGPNTEHTRPGDLGFPARLAALAVDQNHAVTVGAGARLRGTPSILRFYSAGVFRVSSISRLAGGNRRICRLGKQNPRD